MDFTHDVDKKIINGFLQDRRNALTQLGTLGYSKRAVTERAERLGLTRTLLAQHADGELELSARRCLRCDEVFVSQGSFNRLCRRCRSRH